MGKDSPPAADAADKKGHPSSAAEAADRKTSSSSTAAASRTPISPPRFFEEDPVIWLVQLDLFCQIGEKDQLSRFRIAATLLPGHLLRDFADILRTPPSDEPYDALAEAIRQRFGKSVEQRLQSLLSDQQLGDRRPSQFLRHLLDLAEAEGSPAQDSPLVRQIFFNAMPPKIQPFLQCLPQGTCLTTLASTADRLLELPSPPGTHTGATSPQAIYAVTPTPPAATPADVPAAVAVQSTSAATPPDLSALMRQLITGITALTTTVSSLVEVTTRRERSVSTDRRQHRERSATPRGRSPRAAGPLCWYHGKFGANARSCQPPCSWTSGNAN